MAEEQTKTDQQQKPFDKLKDKLKNSKIPEEVKCQAIEKIESMEFVGETGIVFDRAKEYIDWLLSYPWQERGNINPSIAAIKESLQAKFFGHEDVIDTVLDYVVSYLLGNKYPPFRLCFIGKPGTGKTHVARSIAESLGLKATVVTMAGAHDASWMKGVPRHYHGSQPGRIIRGMCKASICNPVIILDEIDKIAKDNPYGSPAESILDAIDPDNADLFEDQYLEIPVDLRSVFFIGIANIEDEVHESLMNRFLVFPFEPYSNDEKCTIVNTYIWPRILEKLGLSQKVTITPDAVKILVSDPDNEEPGVRKIKRELERIGLKILHEVYSKLSKNGQFVEEFKAKEFLADYKFEVNKRTINEWCKKISKESPQSDTPKTIYREIENSIKSPAESKSLLKTCPYCGK